MRVLTIAHGHPDLIRGGAEIAAMNAHRAYGRHPDVEEATFLARADLGQGPLGRISRWKDGEYLWEQSLRDVFFMRAHNRYEVNGYFTELLSNLRPTVVHTHHYFQLGLEYLRAIKRLERSIRVVLTLHDFMAICPNKGLMTTLGGEPCRSGHYADHHRCADGQPVEELWLRKHRFDRYFDHVDHFVAPSEFLRQRYIEWGLPADHITTIENGLPPAEPAPLRPLGSGGVRNRFGFFGQVGEHKGLDVVLEGLVSLPAETRRSIVLEVHGANLEHQPRAYRTRLSDLAGDLVREGTVRWIGPYARNELRDRMAGVDWVIVPSVWPENSPLVIQEAYLHGRPVIVSDTGPLREKTGDGAHGVLLPRANGPAWAEALVRLAADTATWEKFRRSIPSPLGIEQAAQRHIDLVRALGA